MDDDERDELRGQVRKERQMHRALIAHPNPQDPDFPLDDSYYDEDENNERLD